MDAGRPIVFATDFGPGTEWVGVCHCVIASIAPDARIIDLVHSLPRFDAGGSGLILREAMAYAPPCIGVFVVDPGVGTERRAVALRTGRGDVLLGPDNGLLPLAAERIGGITEVRELAAPSLRLPATSATFHARDVFCPAAAQLCRGFAFADVGPPVDAGTLVHARLPLLEVFAGRVVCQATDVDSFGNVRLSARRDALEKAQLADRDRIVLLAPEGEVAVRLTGTFGDLHPDEVGVVEDSFGWLAVCVNRGSAATRLRIDRGARLEIT